MKKRFCLRNVDIYTPDGMRLATVVGTGKRLEKTWTVNRGFGRLRLSMIKFKKRRRKGAWMISAECSNYWDVEMALENDAIILYLLVSIRKSCNHICIVLSRMSRMKSVDTDYFKSACT